MMQTFLTLTRLNRPAGIFLLFWPCCWGLALANAPWSLYLVFFAGSVLMRSAGCVINDFFDRDIDINVQRTQKRPLAAGRVSSKNVIFYLVILLVPSLLILLYFLPPRCWFISAVATLMIVAYPFMKRITFFPQLFLGFTFNIGVIMGWFAVHEEANIIVILLYLVGLLWTLGYDTIYGFQDIEDDVKIGVKSTSIYVKKWPRTFLGLVYGAMLVCLAISLERADQLGNLSLLIFINIMILFAKQVFLTNFSSPDDCLKSFRLNLWVGLLISILWIVK